MNYLFNNDRAHYQFLVIYLSLYSIQKKSSAKMTSNYGNGITIIKGDNGNCTLKKDLSNVGMTGITAFSSFKCGSTKMEKMYNAHMDEVLKKLGKK